MSQIEPYRPPADGGFARTTWAARRELQRVNREAAIRAHALALEDETAYMMAQRRMAIGARLVGDALENATVVSVHGAAVVSRRPGMDDFVQNLQGDYQVNCAMVLEGYMNRRV